MGPRARNVDTSNSIDEVGRWIRLEIVLSSLNCIVANHADRPFRTKVQDTFAMLTRIWMRLICFKWCFRCFETDINFFWMRFVCFKTFEASLDHKIMSRCTKQKQSQTASSGQMFLRYPTYISVTKPPQKWHCAKQRYVKTPDTNLKQSTNQPSAITWSCDDDWS